MLSDLLTHPQDSQPAAHDQSVLQHQITASGYYWQQGVHQDQAIMPAGLPTWHAEPTLQVQTLSQEQHPTSEGGPGWPQPQNPRFGLPGENFGVPATYPHPGSTSDCTSERSGWLDTEAQTASTLRTSVPSEQIHPEPLLSYEYQHLAPDQMCEPHGTEWFEGTLPPVGSDRHFGGDSSAGLQQNFNLYGSDAYLLDSNPSDSDSPRMVS